MEKLTELVAKICEYIITEKTMETPIILYHCKNIIKGFPCKIKQKSQYFGHQIFPDLSKLTVSDENEEKILELLKKNFIVIDGNFSNMKELCKSIKSSIFVQYDNYEKYKGLNINNYLLEIHKNGENLIFMRNNIKYLFSQLVEDHIQNRTEQKLLEDEDFFYRELWYTINYVLETKNFKKTINIIKDDVIGYVNIEDNIKLFDYNNKEIPFEITTIGSAIDYYQDCYKEIYVKQYDKIKQKIILPDIVL